MALVHQRTCRCKEGHIFEVTPCGLEMCQALRELYDRFEPKGSVQGLPPPDHQTRHAWVQTLIEISHNFVLQEQERVVGHAALIPDSMRRDAELLVFLLPSHQERGLGSVLTSLAMEKARELKLRKVMLEVQTRNQRAIRLYKKFNFELCGEACDCERIMVCNLGE